ncbi:UNVERIFIED_CONTAM: hypothetical protein K2H54_010750 [Gekko kuhli]
MGFAEDKVKKFILKNLSMFHDVRVDQLLDHLPCLTLADRQEIRCDMTNKGNVSTVSRFFEHLWGRTRWVAQLIDALEINNSDLAGVIRAVYEDALLPPLQDVVDCRSPVQETKFPSRSGETLPLSGPSETTTANCFEQDLEEKACGNYRNRKTSTPDQRNRNAAESDAGLAAQHENPASVRAASPRSPVQHQTPLRQASEKEVQSSTPVSSSSGAGNLVRNWDGFQPRPVCVKNGYFGNVSRSVDSGVSPVPELAVSPAPATPGNLPEENSYLSSDSSPLTPRGQEGARAEEQKVPPLWGCQQEDPLDNPASKPFLQLQLDEEQKGAQGQQDSAGNVSAVPLLQQEGDRHSWQVNNRRVDFRVMSNEAIPTGSIPANLQRRGKFLPPSIPSETTATNCFEQESSSLCSEEDSLDHSQCCEATCGGQLSEGSLETREPPRAASSLGQSPSKSGQLPQRSSRKEPFGQGPNPVPVFQFRSPPSDFSGSSSTDVIPPSSPAAVSAALSDAYLEDLKPPVRGRNLQGAGPWTTSEKMMGDAPPRANVDWPSRVTDIPENSRQNRNNARGLSRSTHVFHSNHEEEDVALLKPGALLSGEITGGPLDQHSSDGSAEYSGTSARLRFSGGPSEESDPLMLSDSTQGSRSEAPKRNMPMGTNRASLRHRGDDHSDGGSIRTHTVRVEEPPSVDLTGAPEITRPALGKASQPPGDFSDSASGNQLAENGNSRSVRSDGQRNPRQNESVTDAGSRHMSDSALLAVGLTVASLAVVAFVLYKQLKK